MAAFAVAAMGAAAVPALGQTMEQQYEVSLRGVEDSSLEDRLEEFSKLFSEQENPPATLAGVRRRARNDVERLNEVLRAQGYYAGSVDFDINGEAEPVQVTVVVEPGPVYTLEEYSIENVGEHPLGAPIRVSYEQLGLERGAPAQSSAILGAERVVIDQLAERGRPLAEVADRKVVVDHADRIVNAALKIEAGPPALFGATHVTGLDSVDERFIIRRIAWDAGTSYDERLVAETRRNLSETGLFTSIRITRADSVDQNGLLGMTIAVTESPHRTLGAGVTYSTSEGPGAKVYWQHRNLLGEGERLRVSAGGTLARFGLTVSGTKPDFFARNQSLLLDFKIEQEDTDAFVSQTVEASAAVKRQIGEHYAVTAGLTASQSIIEERGQDESFTLVGVPLLLQRDTTDSVLDPTSGARTILSATPYLQYLGSNLNFTVLNITQAAYLPLFEGDLVLAGWGRAGVILGQEAADLPADKRFYAGGGGSIRGYGFQLVGPLDSANNPQGGRSVYEVGTELRYKITDTIGAVAFFEGGNVYTDLAPDFGQDGFLWSAGVGARYYTAIGPLRVDVAFPLDRRNGIDDAFQVYIGLGQAF